MLQQNLARILTEIQFFFFLFTACSKFNGFVTVFLWYTKQISVICFLDQNPGDPLTAHFSQTLACAK